MQQLILKKLSDYNLFSNKENKVIQTALLVSKNEIKIFLKKKIKEESSIKLFNYLDTKILNFKPYFKDDKTIILKGRFNINVNHYVIVGNEKSEVFLTPKVNGILDKEFYYDEKNFGVTINTNNTASFKFWSPPAVKVELLLYDKNQNQLQIPEYLKFKKSQTGIWEFTLQPKDLGLLILDGIYYQYKITAYGKEFIALDPYAKSMAIFDQSSEDVIGKGVLVTMDSGRGVPEKFVKEYSNFKFIENETDIIAYEVNIRDFSIQPNFTDEKIAGTFKGLTENVNYLKELGITHVQIMPVNKVYTQNELDKKYTGKNSKESNYNWGYDPMNYFTLEGRYSTNPYNPYSRILEFREMVQALHDAGIGVILDVVFNHTYIANTFENIAPGCYYRYNDEHKISAHTGAGATIESRRKQVRHFIIDVLKFYVKEYHIDGFRFDLMSFHDKETMRQIRNEVGLVYNPKNKNELILQGEAWNFTDLEKDAVIKTDFESQNIAVFNDTFRDALAGNGKQHGFIHGNANETSKLASAIVAGVNSFDNNNLPFNKDIFFNPYNLFAKQPADSLNFMSVHDGLALWDKINLTVKDENKKERLRLMKFAYSILLTSQGKIILHGGDEILRSKPLADFDKEKHRALTSDLVDKELDTVFFHENSYCSNDYTNMFRWERLTNEYSEFANELLNYVKQLIKMRRNIPVFRFNNSEDINKNITFLDTDFSEKNTIHSFKSHNLERLTLKFKNGEPNKTFYLTGEVHKEKANPKNNIFVLKFNDNGNAKITFTKNEILNFDLEKWDTSRNLNFKLVKSKSKWDFDNSSYSKFGYNSVSPESINTNFEVEIDLSKKDNKILNANNFVDRNYIAYTIDNQKNIDDETIELKKLLIIHNASNEALNFPYKELSKENSYTILDENNAGTSKIIDTNVVIEDGKIIVPQKSSVIVVI